MRMLKAFEEIAVVLRRQPQLIWEMAKEEVVGKYSGQILGPYWAVGHPLILIGVYVFVFTVVFKLRIGGTRELPLDYTTYILSGLVPWMTFQDSMNKGTTSITSNANLVKQVVFPVEILPIRAALASFLTQAVGTAVLVIYVLASYKSLPWTYALLPLLFFFQILGMVGVNFILSSAGTYFRDLKDIVQVFCFAGIYIMPIFYLPEWVPSLFKPLLYINPFSYFAWCYQDACYYGRLEHPWAWCVFLGMSVCVFQLGYSTFKRVKPLFGNVL